MELSKRLRQTREGMKLTLQAVSERTKLGVSTLSDFETGRREPRLGQLKQLADVYHRSVPYFLEESSPPAELVLWRQRPESPDAEQLQAQLLDLADKYHTLEVLCEQPSKPELPSVSEPREKFGYPNAASLARRVRNDLGLGDRPGQTLLRILEEVCHVKVFHLEFEPSGSAACTFSPRFGAAVLLNSKNVRWRRNFDLAHELFHLLTWTVFRQSTAEPSAIPSEREEKLATCFARNLLMPEEVLREAVDVKRRGSGKVGSDGLFEIAREFDVSVEAVLWQIGFVFGSDSERIQAAIDRLRGQIVFWDGRGRDAPADRPLRFQALARQSLRKGLISTGRYAEYVGISRRDAMRVVEEDAVEDVQVEVAYS